MDLVRRNAPGRGGERVLLVMLPGIGIGAEEFAERGFIDAAHGSSAPPDVIACRPDLDLYLDGTVAEALERSVIAPARAEGYRRIWFLGLSLGAMGALLHARAHPGEIEGVLLISPFLGTPGLIAEVARAGGIGAWQPSAVTNNDSEGQLMAWLGDHLRLRPERPALYLGYGLSDRFAAGHALLDRELPAARVVQDAGGHDWPTWSQLWRQLLALRPFGARRDVE